MIRGPGTVGLDSSVSIEELVNTTLEALEYFGVYNISRYYTYHPATLNTDNDHDDVDEHNDHDNNNHNQVRLESSPDKTVETIGYAGSNLNLAVEANDENRSASCHDTNSDSASSSSSSKRTNAIKHPQLPEELILDRRVSMGVYSLFTRF
jgi:hypothetical protein